MARKSILITGCSSGIGYGTAHYLNDRKWRVFATCRSEADCERLRGEGLESFRLDYADPESMAAAVDEALQRTGGTLDALFNNGAFGMPGALEDLPVEGLRALFETNVFGYHELTRQVIPTMRSQGHGRILNCSSVLGFVPFRWRGAYVASKYALEGLTDVLRLEMVETGIHVVSIQPGPITSKIRENSIPHFERWIDWKSSPRAEQYRESLMKRLYESSGPDAFQLEPDAVARKVHRALEARRPHPRYMVTVPTYIMAAFRRVLPVRALDAIIQRGG